MRIRHALVFALIALLAAGMFAGCSGSTEETATSEEQVATGTVEASAETGVSVGDIPPAFTLPDLDGNQVSLADFEGKVVVLDLWATWCRPCREEIPFLIELYDEFESQGLEIVGVGLDQGGAADLAPFVDRNGIDYKIVVGNRSVGDAYQVSGIPTTLFIGRDGRIAHKHIGFSNEMRDEMRTQLEELVAAPDNV